MASNTSPRKLDLSIESLKLLYDSADISPVNVVREVYARIAAYHDKAVWITLVPEQEAAERAELLLLQYPDVVSRLVRLDTHASNMLIEPTMAGHQCSESLSLSRTRLT